jgi:hypothetical protein
MSPLPDDSSSTAESLPPSHSLPPSPPHPPLTSFAPQLTSFAGWKGLAPSIPRPLLPPSAPPSPSGRALDRPSEPRTPSPARRGHGGGAPHGPTHQSGPAAQPGRDQIIRPVPAAKPGRKPFRPGSSPGVPGPSRWALPGPLASCANSGRIRPSPSFRIIRPRGRPSRVTFEFLRRPDSGSVAPRRPGRRLSPHGPGRR